MRFELRNFVLGGLLGIGSLYTLAAVSIPNTFTAGTSIKAAEVNANFAAISAGINALETNKQTRVMGTCGASQAIKEVKADGTVTCEAVGAGGLSSVNANSSLTGNGTTATPLGIANNAITAPMLKTSSAPSGTKFLSYNGTGLAWADGPAFSFGQTVSGAGRDGLVLRNTDPDGIYASLIAISDTGSSIVAQAANNMIGVQGSGGVGLSGTGTTEGVKGNGIIGVSGQGTVAGIDGNGGNIGVRGTGTQAGVSGRGLVGVYASGSIASLQLDGAIQVVGSNKAAFIHTFAVNGTTAECIDNPMTNNTPSAMLMLTAQGSISTPYYTYYSNLGFWCIGNVTPIAQGTKVNVLVIKQ